MRTYAQQKAGLTRAVKKSKATGNVGHVYDECKRTLAEWESEEWALTHRVRRGAWPDDWSRWQRALDDAYPWASAPSLEDLVRA